MVNKEGHRRFGNVRKLPSGRYQARYPGPDGRMRNAPETFARKSDADRYLTLVEAQIARREWIDPERAKVKLATTRGAGSTSGQTCDPERSTCTAGCWTSTSCRTWAGLSWAGWTRKRSADRDEANGEQG
ncbi:hypothetical protein [Micromonospora sp. 15K316]|uniref:hypothetical protein n=1 Tax=Micromonospora sp. 15K316 TaxID=2530376 RepID=UPI001A9E3928|nr:hypothetical protein [Micromonospora sp. 15K316]